MGMFSGDKNNFLLDGPNATATKEKEGLSGFAIYFVAALFWISASQQRRKRDAFNESQAF
ncbi:hypothetical protein ACSS6W_001360 [Trichoderma asperelloides]